VVTEITRGVIARNRLHEERC